MTNRIILHVHPDFVNRFELIVNQHMLKSKCKKAAFISVQRNNGGFHPSELNRQLQLLCASVLTKE